MEEFESQKIVWNRQCTQTQITQAKSSMTITSPDGVREEAFTKSNLGGQNFFNALWTCFVKKKKET